MGCTTGGPPFPFDGAFGAEEFLVTVAFPAALFDDFLAAFRGARDLLAGVARTTALAIVFPEPRPDLDFLEADLFTGDFVAAVFLAIVFFADLTVCFRALVSRTLVFFAAILLRCVFFS
jgi:hypothetical protein